MLKHKFKIIALLLVIILSVTVPIVRAENETINSGDVQIANDVIDDPEADDHQQQDVATPIDEANTTNDTTNTTAPEQTTQQPENTQNSEDGFKKSDVYLAGDNITIDYIIDGNLFVCANSVTINSQIGGDAFIMADSITIGEEGYIFSNLFALSNNVDVKGVVYDIYTVSNNVTISGYVYRDIKVTCNNLNIFGTIGRNAFVNCSNMSFSQESSSDSEQESTITSKGSIVGNLDYSSTNEISIPENTVTGTVNYSKSINNSSETIQDKLFSLGSFVATNIVIWLLCLWLMPKFLKNMSKIDTKKLLPIAGFGILTPIVITIVSIILLILGLTSIAGLILLASLFILISVSTAIFTITANNLICNKLNIEKTLTIFGMLIAASIILWLLKLIPYVGSIISLIAVVGGLGVITYNLIMKSDNPKEKKESITE